jgi:hypothetical protein
MNIVDETHVTLRKYADVVDACQEGQTLAVDLGLSNDDQINAVLTILKVASEITKYGRYGEMTLRSFWQGSKRGILVEVDGTAKELIVERGMRGNG